MMNQVVIVGRLKEINNQEDKCEIKVAVSRTFKNVNGEYEKDIIPCTLWKGISQNACDYLEIDNVVGIKGKLQEIDNNIYVIAEKITFLSNKKEEK